MPWRVPAALCRGLAVEPDHRAADADPAADPITLLAFLPGEIQLRNAILLIPAVISGAVLYPLWHNAPYTPRIWPLAIAVGWAQALALWDYARGKVMSWQPTRGPGDATRRFWWALLCWNGTLAWRGSASPPGASSRPAHSDSASWQCLASSMRSSLVD